jgi:sulfonate transport system substrate-binding protein
MSHELFKREPRALTQAHHRRELLRLLALSAGAWGLTAPFTTPSAFAQGKDRSASKHLQQLRIGYQKSAVNLVILKQQGVLEKRFPTTKVSWIEFPAGPQLLEALSVGALEFGLTGDAPPVFAQAAGKDLYYVGAEPAKPESSAVLVLQDSPIKSLVDLKGKKIALQKGSSAHYLLVRAIEKTGLQWTDIQPIYLTPADARAAFERKSVDAWAIWDPFYAATELALPTRVLTTGVGLSGNNSFYLSSTALANQYPEVLLALFEELSRADRFVQEHRPEAIKLIANFSGLDAGVVSLFLKRRPRSPVGLLSAEAASSQQQVADAFTRLALIPKPVRVVDIVWRFAR